jgi:hypothetical protein
MPWQSKDIPNDQAKSRTGRDWLLSKMRAKKFPAVSYAVYS